MYAIAIFDNKENNLFLIRDRMGEKPLYYGFQNGVFLFASELKSILSNNKKVEFFLDLPVGRIKPPNNRYSLDDIISIINRIFTKFLDIIP